MVNLFKRAFVGEVNSVPAYKECSGKSGESKILCVLSVYNSGKNYDDSKTEWPTGTRTIKGKKYAVGWKYAEEVISFKQNWEAYFEKEEKPEFTNSELILFSWKSLLRPV